MSKARLAYVINSVEGGGAQSPVPAIAGVLRDEGVAVRVFALSRREGRGLPAMDRAGLDPLVREGGEADHFAAKRWLEEQLLEWGATHIWTSLSRATILGLLVGPKLGLPVVCWQHNARLKPWNRRLLRLLQARAALWVGDSRSVTELTAQRLAISRDRLATWPIFYADPQMPLAASWQAGLPLRLGSLGRLHPNKGYDVLIAALGRLKADGFASPVPFSVAIAGEGAERGRLEALARETGVEEIHFPGYVDDPRAFLATLHLYLQPSRSEGFCIAAHEALTAGLPVIGADVGEMPYSIAEGRTGHLVPPGDVDALATALGKALWEPGALAEMGMKARTEMLRRFSHEGFARTGSCIWRRVSQDSASFAGADEAIT